MCSITAVGLVITAASAAAGVIGQAQSVRAQEKAQKQQAEYNTKLASDEMATQQALAQNEVQKGIAERNRHLRQASQGMGAMRSMLGASGFTFDAGSQASMLSDTAEEYQYNADIITQNANMAAWQHQMAGANAQNRKSMFDYQYANAGANRAGANLSTAGSILGGIGQGLGMYADYNKTKSANQKTATSAAANNNWDLYKASRGAFSF